MGTIHETRAAPGQKIGSGNDDRPVIDISSFGATGDGRTDNAQLFRAAFQRAATLPKAEIRLPRGVFLLKSPEKTSDLGIADRQSLCTFLQLPDSDLRIIGAGMGETRIVTAVEGTLFEGINAPGSNLALSALSVEYTGGFSSLTDSFGIRFAGRTLTVTNVRFKNFTQAIRIPEGVEVRQITLRRCHFDYDYGRAGICQADPTFQYPITSILGAGDLTLIEGCEFNGLIDPTFATATLDRFSHAKIDPSQLTPIDGLIKTINMGRTITLLQNTVRNGGIEHVLIDGPGKPTDQVEIGGNTFYGPDPTGINPGTFNPRKAPKQTHSVFYYSGMGGIISTRAGSYIHDNRIADTAVGVGVSIGPGAAETGIRIVRNQIFNCMTGIQIQRAPGALVQGNTITFSREYAAAERETGESATQTGVRLIDSPQAQIKENEIRLQNAGWWAGELTTAAELPAGGQTLAVASVPAPLLNAKHFYIYLGPPENPVLCSPATAASSQQIQISWPASTSIPIGSQIVWSTGNIVQQAGICAYRSSGAITENNTIQGGIQPIVHFDEKHNGPVYSRRDNLIGYAPVKNGSVQYQ